jgi:predicted PurR-regulated permease PerM
MDNDASLQDGLTSQRQARAVQQIALVLYWTAGTIAVVAVLWALGDVLLLVFAAALLAAGLRGAATRVSRTLGCPESVSLAAVVLILTAVLGLTLWWTGPRFVTEAALLRDQLTTQWHTLRAWLGTKPWGDALLNQLPSSLGGGTEGSIAPRVAGTIAGALWSAVGLLGTLILLVASTLYFAAAPYVYIDGSLRLVPRRIRGRTREIVIMVGHTLKLWLAGQLFDMLVVGVVTGTGLFLLDIPLAFILGVLAGLLNFVPYVGAIAGAVPAILIALAKGPQDAIFVAALYLVVQGLEGNVLSPLIQRRAVDLPPAATILAQTALGGLFGLPGIIFATPLAAAILATLRELTSDSSGNNQGHDRDAGDQQA